MTSFVNVQLTIIKVHAYPRFFAIGDASPGRMS